MKNEGVTVLDGNVLDSEVVNYSALATDQGLVLHTSVTIGYDVDWRQVHELLIAAARQTEAILDDPAPFVLQTSLDDYYVSYQINAYTRAAGRMAQLYSELHQNILDAFHSAGVEIMSPAYTALRAQIATFHGGAGAGGGRPAGRSGFALRLPGPGGRSGARPAAAARPTRVQVGLERGAGGYLFR